MGAGIAQVAAVAGRRVLLADAVPGAAERAVATIGDRVKSQVARGRISVDPESLSITAVNVADLGECDVVVEAIVEDLAVKKDLFANLEGIVAPDAILASNTSSLSPTAIAAGLRHPDRVVGLHFFNPVPAMKLVEVVSGLATAPAVADAAANLAQAWGKTVVRAAAAPGFIVNRIARPYYAEAWRGYEAGAASPEVIDAVLTGAGGFRMGPFALMDLVGHDVNEAVTRTVWTAFGHDPRYSPSLAQRALVEGGRYGRKTGRGIYSHGDDAPVPRVTPAPAGAAPAAVTEHGRSPLRSLLTRAGVTVTDARVGPARRPAGIGWPGEHGEASTSGERDGATAGFPDGMLTGLVELPSGGFLAQCDGTAATSLAAALDAPVVVVDRALDYQTASAIAVAPSDGCPGQTLAEATGLLGAAGLEVHVIDDIPGLIVTRTVAMLVNSAVDALASGVASAGDIDTAMRLGVNYPRGPLAWGREWSARDVLTILDSLENWHRDGHYRAAPRLRRAALSGRDL
jgi:3-hydroxybutyryl-CoA dehydrogenase